MQRVKLSGTPVEMGRQHGKAVKQKIGILADSALPRQEGRGEQLHKAVRDLREYLEGAAPYICQEIDGLAEATGLTRDQAFRLSHSEDTPGMEVPWPGVSADCTICILRGQDGVILANSMDIGERSAPLFSLYEVTPDKGYRCVYTERAGVVGASRGMNEKGLAMGGASACYSGKAGPGLGVFVRMRVALQTCATVDEVIRLFEEHDMPSKGLNYGLVDREGNGAVIQATHGAMKVIRLEDGFLYATNRFYDDSLKHLNASRGEQNARSCETRESIMHNTLSSSTSKRTLDDAMNIMKLHSDNEFGVCNHAPYNTAFSIVAHPSTGSFYLADGKPCQIKFERAWQAVPRA